MIMPTLCRHHASVYRTRAAAIRHLPHDWPHMIQPGEMQAPQPTARRLPPPHTPLNP